MIEPASLGGKLRAARERLKLRPVDAAKRIGVSKASYSRWESSGEDFPRGRNLQAIHEVLGIPLAELVAAGRTKVVGTKAGAAQGSQCPICGAILTAPEGRMTDDDRKAWEEFNQIVNGRKKKRKRDWGTVRGMLLGMVGGREHPRQPTREKPAARIAKIGP